MDFRLKIKINNFPLVGLTELMELTLSDRVIPIGITNFLTSSTSINTIKCLMIPFGVIKS